MNTARHNRETLPATHELADPAGKTKLQLRSWKALARGTWLPAENLLPGETPKAYARPRRPEVGMGCTIQIGSDYYAGTVVSVSRSLHRVEIQRDRSRRTRATAGQREDQQHLHEVDPNGPIETATYRVNLDRWLIKGTGQYVTFGVRHAYTDPSF
jgi:hypothetical protein